MSLFEKLELRTVNKTTTEGFSSCSNQWTNYTSNVNILTYVYASSSLLHRLAKSHMPRSFCGLWFFYHTKQKETHGDIYSLGAAAPALEVHGLHSLSVSIFISALQECRWPDALVSRLAIDSQSSGRRHGAGDGREPNKLMAPVAARAGRIHWWLLQADD